MQTLGLKVPYLSEWADKQAASKRLTEGWASDAEPASKRQRVGLPQETADPGSALAASMLHMWSLWNVPAWTW